MCCREEGVGVEVGRKRRRRSNYVNSEDDGREWEL
jgi:hypothetical protein